MNNETKITYYGQSLFVIESQSSIKIGIDPYNKFTRPNLPSLAADIVLITHNHPDHANISLFKDSPTVIKVPGITNVKGIDIEGIPTYHDNLRVFFSIVHRNYNFWIKFINNLICFFIINSKCSTYWNH